MFIQSRPHRDPDQRRRRPAVLPPSRRLLDADATPAAPLPVLPAHGAGGQGRHSLRAERSEHHVPGSDIAGRPDDAGGGGHGGGDHGGGQEAGAGRRNYKPVDC